MALWFGLPAFLAGGYWFVRNLVAVGNPIPYTNFGPLGCRPRSGRSSSGPGYSVFHYWDDTEVWREWFVPGLARVVRGALAAGDRRVRRRRRSTRSGAASTRCCGCSGR